MDAKEILSQRFENKYDILKLKGERRRGTNLLDIDFIYPHTAKIELSMRSEISELFKEYYPSFDVQVNFFKSFLDETEVSLKVLNFIKNNFSIIEELVKLSDIIVDESMSLVSFTIITDESIESYIQNKDFINKLKEMFETNYHYDFIIKHRTEIFEDDEQKPVFVEFEKKDYKPREINISDVQKLIGDDITEKPSYNSDLKSPREFAIACGKIIVFEELKTKEKTKDNGDVVPPKPYFKFSIEDPTGILNCICFSTQSNYTKLQKLAVGSCIVVSGPLLDDSFSVGVIMRPKNISFCDIPTEFKEVVNYKGCPLSYKYIFPEPVVHVEQVDFFSLGERFVHDFLLNNDIVVFDFETTGLSPTDDKIIEIGAVKIVKGEYHETFSSFVNPNMRLPEKIIELTGITDKDLVNAPTYPEALQDFYKFTNGCVLSGYNIDNFDCLFLRNWGSKAEFNFDNNTLDVYKLVASSVRGVKNYKLKTIAEHLGVSLVGAHRAVNDAIATADVLIKLQKDLDKVIK